MCTQKNILIKNKSVENKPIDKYKFGMLMAYIMF